MEFECIADCRNLLGESCFWDLRDGMLWWTDIEGRRACRLNDDGSVSEFRLPDRAGFILPRRESGFVVGFAGRIALANQDLKSFEHVADIEPDISCTRVNDAAVDPHGGIVFGTYDETADRSARKPVASVYRLAPDGSVSKLFGGIIVTNGLEFSLDGGTMYFADTSDGAIRRYSANESFSAIEPLEHLAEAGIADGNPDGATIDSDGNYWSARVRGGCAICISPGGQLLRTVAIPANCPTCLAFGGPDLRDLYATSLRVGQSDADLKEFPCSGGLFKARSDVPGRPQPLCAL